MDYRYVKYINDSCYYTKPAHRDEGTLTLESIPSDFEIIKGEHWTNIFNPNQRLPKQGWKIHISTQLKTAKKTLNIVSELMFKEKISFKYVKNMHELILKNSKYGDRSSSGKFITIYPSSVEQFINLLIKLENKLFQLPNGPYILNDKRWYKSNVYFRYGGFMPRTFYYKGKILDAIEDPNGNLIEDQRKPFYMLPDFIEEPEQIKKMNLDIEKEYQKTYLDDYNIEEALHFSNGGGVYLAEHDTWGKVVLKEGRPHAATGFDDIDAFERVENEGKILKELQQAIYPVEIYDSFVAWEHKFIVEEYIEGNSLSIWIVNNYPFYSKEKNESYMKSSINILNGLIESIEEIHKLGVGFGDLQPANIIVTSEESIRLIDFETAGSIEDPISSVMTPGFIGSPEMNKQQSDWFAVLRIAKQMFIPIGNVQDISHNLDKVHNSWIKETFGQEALNIINKIESICKKHNSRPMKEFINSQQTSVRKYDLLSVKEKLIRSIKDDLREGELLIHGDIRQYEMDSGKWNVLTGGFGAIMAVKRAGEWDSKFDKWINSLDYSTLINLENGLYTGKIGIANILIEVGYIEKAKKLIETIDIEDNIQDISIASGLSGIGLGFLSIYYEFEDNMYLEKCKKIGELLEENFLQNIPVYTFDYDIVDKGFLTSWSGASLFMSCLYKATNNRKWFNLSRDMLDRELEKTLFDDDGLFQVDDEFRILPYLSSGGSGLSIPMIIYENIANEKIWTKELEGIAKISKSKMFFNGGLFQGTTGVLSISHLLDDYLNKDDLVNSSLFTLNLHLIETEKHVYMPGDSCFRISSDLMSGSSGLLLVIQDIISNNYFSWLPLLNIDNLIDIEKIKKGR